MKNFIIVLIAGLFSITSFAHNPATSTTVLVERENNLWFLQISASLTAFQKEIRTHFGDTPYKTPEEFQEMVLQHVKNNFEMRINGNETITLSNGKVQLGHETNVVFEVVGVPSGIKSVAITNKAFKDIYKSKSAFIVLNKNFEKKEFILNDTNEYSSSLKVNDNVFVEVIEQKASLFPPLIITSVLGFLGLGLGLGFLVQYIYKRRKFNLLKN